MRSQDQHRHIGTGRQRRLQRLRNSNPSQQSQFGFCMGSGKKLQLLETNKIYYLESKLIKITFKQAAGKGTGIVTTTRITHATPAGAYAHVANRDWEDDASMISNSADPNACDDIAEQLVQDQTGSNFKVILGGGRAYFEPNTLQDPETGSGRRRDGKNLITTWETAHPSGKYVWNRNDLLAINTATTSNILGIN